MTLQDAPIETAPVPILLLKTRSVPEDGYEKRFSEPVGGRRFAPAFVPVLQHTLIEAGLERIRTLLREGRFGRHDGALYSGLVFTSQRAVEAFAAVVQEPQCELFWHTLQHIPVYSVGPATTKALSAIHRQPPLTIQGEHTGNGRDLAAYILANHRTNVAKQGPSSPSPASLAPLLFVTGEQRLDTLRRALTDPVLSDDQRLGLEELEVYGTEAMPSFPSDFSSALQRTSPPDCGGARAARWVAVFSPTGCDAMLKGLGLLDAERGGEIVEKAASRANTPRTTRVVTIGPTTRDHLRNVLGFEPDAWAKKPSPEGMASAIVEFMETVGEI